MLQAGVGSVHAVVDCKDKNKDAFPNNFIHFRAGLRALQLQSVHVYKPDAILVLTSQPLAAHKSRRLGILEEITQAG